MFNPFSSYRITATWADHIARGSLGGIDYGTPVGTPIPACSSGIVSFDVEGTGGNTATLTRSNGTKTQYMHLSKFGTPGAVSEGDIIGLTGGAVGAPGSGNSTGPHCHVHDINAQGERIMPFTSPEPQPAATEIIRIEEHDMAASNYVNLATCGPNGAIIAGKTLCATGGDQPGMGAANWREYVRTQKKGERATLEYKRWGTHVPLSGPEWAAMKAAHLAPLQTRSV
jgi:Membrane proteins related to metalloendopeptidases